VAITSRSETQHHFEAIQQWQYIGNVNPALLTANAFQNCKKYGITSVQSYVTWAQIEATRGQPDFSVYDELVQHLLQHNLKWVPFLILGPYYATPTWFQKSDQSLYAVCLEHRKSSKIQSIWNPNLSRCVDRFLTIFADHYSDPGLFESIALGISGNWGEALYPATGGFSGGFHTHPGWWCGDDFALQDFRAKISQKYSSVAALNNRWGTHFKDFSEASFPEVGRSLAKDGLDMLRNSIPPGLKPLLSRIRSHFAKIQIPLFFPGSNMPPKLNAKKPSPQLQHWADFTAWYQDAMTDWAQYWLARARAHFPETTLYLVTGGRGGPMLGADFAAQAKMAKQYAAGIRITNQNDDYRQSFILTRLVSAACRNYGTYFTTEESGVNRPHGVTMRIFDAATSAARGAYFKSIIANDSRPCGGQDQRVGEPTRGAIHLSENLRYILTEPPIIEVAVLFPNTAINITPSVLNALYYQGGIFRTLCDFDLVDENMINDNLLGNYRFLVLLVACWIQGKTLQKMMDWIAEGGIVMTGSHLWLNRIGKTTIMSNMRPAKHEILKRIHKGFSICLKGSRHHYLQAVADAIYNRKQTYPWNGIAPIPAFLKGRYVTRFSNRLMSYDPKRSKIQLHRLEK
jgi:hypothetical protein